MTLAERIQEVWAKQDAKEAEVIMMKLAARGMTYRESCKFVQEKAGIEPPDWDALVAEAKAH